MLCENVIDVVDLLLSYHIRYILRVCHLDLDLLVGDHICLFSIYGSYVLFQSSPFRLRYLSLYTHWLLVARRYSCTEMTVDFTVIVLLSVYILNRIGIFILVEE